MKKIKVSEIPAEFGIMFPKKKKVANVIELVDSDEGKKARTQIAGIKANTPKTVSASKKPKTVKPKKPKPDTNSKPVNSKTDKKIKLKSNKLKPGQKRPAVIDGMNVLYYDPNQNKPGIKGKPGNKLNFENLVMVVAKLQELGYDSKNIHIVVQAYVVGKTVKNSINFGERKKIFKLLRPSETRYINEGTSKTKRIESHDDKEVIEMAKNFDGIIVSNDEYRDHVREFNAKQDNESNDFLAKRSLTYKIMNMRCSFPVDPMGKNSPICLEEFITVQSPKKMTKMTKTTK